MSSKQTIEAVRNEANKRGFTRLLLNMRKMSTPDTELTRFYSGEHVAKILRAPFKVAVFANPESINRFAETVAVNRGAQFAVFSDEKTAIQWLMQGADQPDTGDCL